MAAVVDTGVLFALADQRDFRHKTVREHLIANPDTLIVPGPVVWETCAIVLERLGPEAELSFLRSLAAEELTRMGHQSGNRLVFGYEKRIAASSESWSR